MKNADSKQPAPLESKALLDSAPTSTVTDTSKGCRSCMAIPGKILEIVSDDDNYALVDALGVRRKINVALIQEEHPAPGDWVLIHVGFAMSKISEADALDHLHTMELLGEKTSVICELSR